MRLSKARALEKRENWLQYQRLIYRLTWFGYGGVEVKVLSIANFTINLRPLSSFRYLLISLILLILLIWPQTVAGQETPITASVNRNELSTDDLVTLTVTVVDQSA